MYEAIFFDFDYTLGDSTNGIVLSINYALNKLGYDEKCYAEIKKTIGLSLKDTYSLLIDKDDEKEAVIFARYFKEKADKVMTDNTTLYEGVREKLLRLKNKGYKIGIITTKFHYRIEQILEKYKANDMVDLIVGAEDVKLEKPHPEGLLCAIEYLGVDKRSVLYVGDSIVDAQTAQNASVDFCGVLTGTTIEEDFQKYSKLCVKDNVSQVCDYILKLK